MNVQQLKEQIDEYNKKIEDSIMTHEYVLNQTILEYTKKIEELQKICPHSFNENNVCIYCGVKGENQ